MEFSNRKQCVSHYQDMFPNLPQYMIELALDYDLNRVKPTGTQKRALKRNQEQRQSQSVNFNPETAVRIIKPCDDSRHCDAIIEVENVEQNQPQKKSTSILDDGDSEKC